ncbi:hypothetical protein CAPN004_04400 [Capnocytophaga cynodegmi]|uniref:hypothetical protein n=1 Tax=Capnocytophaga cynodegmi TaxID=28189 RepID=UPI001AC0DC63|nr:hypothetical protein [Capnocytophaga cynodegmi]GIM51410.1 hypothetical protein CAPN004_04400 [Capnocytophaga cynodegmi]
MSSYTLICNDIRSEKYTSLQFTQDVFPLEQNCDLLEIYKIYDHNELRLWYDDGTQKATYSRAFDFIYIDSQDLRVTIWISEENKTDNRHPNGLTQIIIQLQKSELLYKLQDFFTFDKMIAFEDWI